MFPGGRYGLITKLSVVVAAAIYVIYALRAVSPEQTAAGLTSGTLAQLTTLSFLCGAACSGLSGYVGMVSKRC